MKGEGRGAPAVKVGSAWPSVGGICVRIEIKLLKDFSFASFRPFLGEGFLAAAASTVRDGSPPGRRTRLDLTLRVVGMKWKSLMRNLKK